MTDIVSGSEGASGLVRGYMSYCTPCIPGIVGADIKYTLPGKVAKIRREKIVRMPQFSITNTFTLIEYIF